MCTLFIAGCGSQKEATSKDAIEVAKAMDTVKEQTEYLLSQAKSMYNSKQFQDTIDIAQYILRYLDKDSQEAKNLIEQAKEAVTKQAKKLAGDAQKKLDTFGRE
jgi:hypothetical protein